MSNGNWKRDVFLSHASLDKEAMIRPFVRLLEERDISYWLDEAEIKWGESLVGSVSQGLETSRFVLVFLTENFLARPWTDVELRNALNKEITTRTTIVLPVFICDTEKILAKHPFLRDKKWLRWDQGSREVVRELEAALGRSFETRWQFEFPADYRGHVWIKIMPRLENEGKSHNYKIVWGKWRKPGQLEFKDTKVWMLDFQKIAEDDTYPLTFEISPPAFVTWGKGNPVQNIDEGWQNAGERGTLFGTASKKLQMLLTSLGR